MLGYFIIRKVTLSLQGQKEHLVTLLPVPESTYGDRAFPVAAVRRRVFYFFCYEILVDSTLATRRNGEQKISCLHFASSVHNVASEVMETFCIFV